jgi:hypothetical protein
MEFFFTAEFDEGFLKKFGWNKIYFIFLILNYLPVQGTANHACYFDKKLL